MIDVWMDFVVSFVATGVIGYVIGRWHQHADRRRLR